ncbi:hypothetical protein [Rhizobium sp. EC-SD404]|uniref:hypothetical protein n=1 Tax=Rhizobium sp. EC-SD404 TaxID=2038389 RepID=UPI001258C545|nr:hypothetical protein [Rhizobium sp. EC-SD404]VVT32900.1 conserved hypothetical protein [Rhizobium sp. EC-SD404]
MIKSPTSPKEHPDRLLSCEEALQEQFNSLIDQFVSEATSAGWEAAEAEEAVLSLAQSRRWAALENEKTAGAIDEVWEEMGGRTEH